MSMAEMIPALADADLVSLQSNATRLQTTGTDKQQRDAAELLPLIAAEIADRKAKAPPKPARKTAVRKKKEAVVEMDEDERALAE
jgi:hypothetical protein